MPRQFIVVNLKVLPKYREKYASTGFCDLKATFPPTLKNILHWKLGFIEEILTGGNLTKKVPGLSGKLAGGGSSGRQTGVRFDDFFVKADQKQPYKTSFRHVS